MDSETLRNGITQLIPLATSWAIKIIGVLVALFVLRIVANLLAGALRRSLEKRDFDATLTKFFSNILRYAILAAGVIGCLGVFGIETTSFAAVIAAAGLAIGMALQGTLGNFAAGVMLLIFRPFKVGDLIRTAGELGRVEELELFTTAITTPDSRRIIVPNSKVFGDTIENLSHHALRRVDVPVGTAYEADVDQTRKTLEACVTDIPYVQHDPAPQIFLKELGASSVDWEVRVWCKSDDYWDAYQATIRAAKIALDAAKVSIPYPQMDVHLDSSALQALGVSATSPAKGASGRAHA